MVYIDNDSYVCVVEDLYYRTVPVCVFYSLVMEVEVGVA